MNTDQQTRLEIMRALGEEFPNRPLEDLLHVARYVEHGGVKQAEQTGPPSGSDEPRTWVSLADIPETVGSVEDREGDQIKRIVTAEQTEWVHTSHRYLGLPPMDDDGPFIEVPS